MTAPHRLLRIVLAASAFLPASDRLVAEETPPKPISYVEGRGLVWRAPDGAFELGLGFNLQVRYTHTDLDEISGEDSDSWRVRRFKLVLGGFAWSPKLTWRFQAAFESPNSPRLLDDAWLNWRFSDAAAVQGGQYKTPYSREELFNDGVLQFTERALEVDAFKPGRDVGMMAAGSFKKGLLAYQAGVFGGAGQTTARTTAGVMPVLRLVVNPFGQLGQGEPDLDDRPEPALSFGVDGFTNTLRKATAAAFDGTLPFYAAPAGWLGRGVGLFEVGEDVRVKGWSLDAQLKWHGLSALAEYHRGQARGEESGARLHAYGWHAQAGYTVLPKRLDVAARYAFVDYDRNVSRDAVSAVTAAAAWYVRKHHLKLQLDYTRTRRQRAAGPAAEDQTVMVQAQLFP